ncbi:putative short-chain dehydrogenase [Mycena galericulata]|nr:putative short-chain dehydrogenase [Mycena galericulata]
MPDYKGTILVTGASGSLGSAVVAKIASTPELAGAYHGIYTVRNASATQVVAAAEPAETHKYDIVSLDLARLCSVREVAATVNARVAAGEIPPIRALILNASWQEYEWQTLNEHGFDMAFATNYLGHWLLTLLLLRSMDRERGRVVVVGGISHDTQLADLNKRGFPDEKWKTMLHDSSGPIARGTWSNNKDDPSWASGFRRYGASKLCQLLMIGELQRRLDTDFNLKSISVLGVDPGSIPTAVARRRPWLVRVLISQLVIPSLLWLRPNNGSVRTVERSAGDLVAAALDADPLALRERPKGLYLNGSALGEMSAETRDPVKGKMLWQESIEYAWLMEGDTYLANWR